MWTDAAIRCVFVVRSPCDRTAVLFRTETDYKDREKRRRSTMIMIWDKKVVDFRMFHMESKVHELYIHDPHDPKSRMGFPGNYVFFDSKEPDHPDTLNFHGNWDEVKQTCKQNAAAHPLWFVLSHFLEHPDDSFCALDRGKIRPIPEPDVKKKASKKRKL